MILQRLLCGQPPIPNLSLRLPASIEVGRERGSNLVNAIAVTLLQPLRHAPVDPCPSCLTELLVQHFNVQGVLKSIVPAHGSVRPGLQSPCLDELTLRRHRFTFPVDLRAVLVESGRRGGTAELESYNAGCLQDMSALVG